MQETATLPAPTTNGTANNPAALPAWRQKLVAVLVTFHLFATLLYVAPYPPYMDDRAMGHPEVKREMELLFKPMYLVIPYGKDWTELKDTVLGLVRQYTATYFKVRKLVEWYMDAASIQQAWNMFGGTPPHFPRVFMVEIKPLGATEFLPYRDFHWGGKDESEYDFRHRKTHEILGLGGWDRQREDYANYWARLWNREHPGLRVHQVRIYYWQLTTPPPEKARAGDMDRHPQRVNEFNWTVPADLQ